jgi:hypothetical protein
MIDYDKFDDKEALNLRYEALTQPILTKKGASSLHYAGKKSAKNCAIVIIKFLNDYISNDANDTIKIECSKRLNERDDAGNTPLLAICRL